VCFRAKHVILMENIMARLSKVETVKRESRGLRGGIGEALARDGDAFPDRDAALLKFHGTYQQYDRDTATARKRQGQGREHSFMVRVRVPGGRLTPEQYLALDDLAGRHGNGTLRITTRQTFQLHGVIKGDLKATIAGINHTLLTTLATCGDVVRNVVTTPVPVRDAVHARLAADARAISRHFLPTTGGYHEIWLDGEKVEDSPDPIYRDHYLPRKFKIALATPDDNAPDLLTNDLGLLALFEDGALIGYDLYLGGGQGMTHNKPNTYPRLATPIAFVGPDRLVPAVEAVVGLQRDHGDRVDRRHARLKYLVEEQGAARIKALLESYMGGPLEDPRPHAPLRVPDLLGWHGQGDGRFWLGVPVASGRIRDDGSRLRTALREVVGRFRLEPILTPAQDILLAGIRAEDRAVIEAILRGHGVALAEDLRSARRTALACPALPTCGLALAEAERVQGPLLDGIEAGLARHGLENEPIVIRMTGCPNGCARPYAAEIGIVGRMPGHYVVLLGGDRDGTRLNRPFADKVALEAIPATLEPLFALFAAERRPGEAFGDFCERVGIERLQAVGGPALATAAE
jgi:sulfite reductase (ferredoxin)